MFRHDCRIVGRVLTFSVMVFSLILFGISYPAAAANQKAVVQVTASDWTSAAHAVVDVDPVGGPRSKQLDLFAQASSDFIVRSYGDYFYMIGRYYTDSLTKFHIDSPTTPVYQVSVLEGGAVSSNPHDMIFVNDQKAYMPMYELNSCWIVNPQTGLQTGSIDLSAYAGSDGIPEMHTGVIVRGKLFLLIQNLDQNQSFDPAGNGYLVVIDTATDQEIDTTGGQAVNGVMGIELPGKNPVSIQYLPENDTIYIACVGVYPGYSSSPDLYTGGIVTVNPDTYGAGLLVDDGPAGTTGDHPYGAISGVMVTSPAKGYFIGYVGWGDNYLFTFNPTSGAVTGQVATLDGMNLSPMDCGLAMDENGLLWVSAGGTAATVYIVNPSTDGIDEAVGTNLNPATIAFCPQTIMPGSNQVNSATGTGAITFAGSTGVLQNMAGQSEDDYDGAPNKPEDLTFVDGLASFEVAGLLVTGAGVAGTTVQVTITWPSVSGDDAVYYGVNGNGFYEFNAGNMTRDGDNTVTLTLVDGGYGDGDGEKNGTIVHVSGWAWTPAIIGGGGGDGGGGGGCFIGVSSPWFK